MSTPLQVSPSGPRARRTDHEAVVASTVRPTTGRPALVVGAGAVALAVVLRLLDVHVGAAVAAGCAAYRPGPPADRATSSSPAPPSAPASSSCSRSPASPSSWSSRRSPR